MWSLTQKKDKLWVKWIHNYYRKGKKPWEVQSKQASWTVQRILQAGYWLDKVRIQKERITEANTYLSKRSTTYLEDNLERYLGEG